MYTAHKPNIIKDECIYLCLLTVGTEPAIELYMDITQTLKG